MIYPSTRLDAALTSINSSLGGVEAHPVSIGIAVNTSHAKSDGDVISFFLTETHRGTIRIEDACDTLPLAFACGTDLVDAAGAPSPILASMLETTGVQLDPVGLELFLEFFLAEEAGPAALSLVEMLRGLDEAMAHVYAPSPATSFSPAP